MGATYGARFIDLWKDVDLTKVKAHWAVELAEFRGETIGDALKMMIRHGGDWPPTLPTFIGFCEEARKANPRPVTNPLIGTMVGGSEKCDPNAPEVVEARARCMATARRLGMLKLVGQTVNGDAAQ